MTTNRDFKRLVRGRMQKTGESYTAARAQLLRQSRPSSSAASAAGPSPVPPSGSPPTVPVADYARVAGLKDATLKARTGCTWEKWVHVLDRAGAFEWPHARIAEVARTKYKAGPWWGQMVAVGYERIKGLRARGQQRSGEYRANKSRTLSLPLSRLYRAFAHRPTRERWLPGVTPTVRSSTPGKYLRWNWPDGTQVELSFLSKGRSKAQVAIQHGRLPDQSAAGRMKAFWAERLEALASLPAPRRA